MTAVRRFPSPWSIIRQALAADVPHAFHPRCWSAIGARASVLTARSHVRRSRPNRPVCRSDGSPLPVALVRQKVDIGAQDDGDMLALSDSQLRALWEAAAGLPIEKRGIFLLRLVAQLQFRDSNFTTADLDDAVRLALKGLIQKSAA